MERMNPAALPKYSGSWFSLIELFTALSIRISGKFHQNLNQTYAQITK